MQITFLQIFLIVDVFLIGVACTLAARHAYAHFRPAKTGRIAPQTAHLPPALRQQILQEAQANFERMLKQTTAEVQQDLLEASKNASKMLNELSNSVVAAEVEHYKKQLEDLRTQTEADITGANGEIEQHRNELKEQLAAQVAGEKEKLLKQIDTQLGDAVASFLLDTLQHDVDLGAQTQYLTKMLEEHKEDFKKGVAPDETPAS